MDSRIETYKHIDEVRRKLLQVVAILNDRLMEHDQSKLVEPEKSTFDEYTDRLKGSTYGSDEYKEFLAKMKPALDHHYKQNRHHPEHFANGVRDMNLIDLVEMLCDWFAATMRHADGDIQRSIEVNQKRFGYTDELKGILQNTAIALTYRPSWHCLGCGASGCTGNFCERCGAGKNDYVSVGEKVE